MTILPFILGVLGLSLIGAVRSARSARSGSSPASPHRFEEGVLLEIRVPKANEMLPLAAEQMFASLHGLLRAEPEHQEHISFEIAADSSGIHFYVWCPKHLQEFVEGQVYAQYPLAELRPVEHDYMQADLSGLSTCGGSLILSKDSFFPTKTFRDFEVDPLAAMTGSMSEVGEGERIWVQILVRPIPDVWQAAGHKYVEEVKTGVKKMSLGLSAIASGVVEELGNLVPFAMKQFANPASVAPSGKPPLPPRQEFPRLSPGQELELKMIEDKLTRVGFETVVRIFTAALDPENCRELLRGAAASFRQFSSASLNSFTQVAPTEGIPDFKEKVVRREFPAKSYVMDTAELASVFHLPNISVQTPAIAWATYKKGEPPANIPTSDCIYFAQTTFREKFVKFGIKRVDRRQHMYLVGKTGTGKTTVFKNMIVQDMQNGEGVAVLDPHGDLVKELLDFVPAERLHEVVYFDPSDTGRPIGLNLLELQDSSQKNLLASGLLDAFKKHFIDISWGPRLEYLLNNAILTLLEVPGTTLMGITRLLSDKNYQKYIVYKLKDPVLKEFWEKEYTQMMTNPRLHTEAVAPIQNKVGRFLSSSTIRNVVGQRTSSLDLDAIMNEGKILLVNLSKGKIGEDNANLLGSLLISRINFTAMQRVNIPEDERRDFYFYADEFQNFASGSFASILSEARKYRLNLHLTHQYTAQLPESMQDAVFGNIGTMVLFSVGAPDAQILEKEFLPYFTMEDLISLDQFHIYLKLLVDGMTSKPFSAISLTPPEGRTYQGQAAVAYSREVYGRDAAEIEDKIRRWSERPFALGMAIAEEKGESALPNASQGRPVVEPAEINDQTGEE
ncbi:MAG: type IV secretion system DNA-binding domain-containing protein [candidate division WWE3 bacterium]|nr:type IV secretion system DNA-binding domain-containing protein [candidate division WWE3 bacterium]